MNEISEKVLELLQKKYTIKDVENIEEFNFIESGYVDSIGLVKFIVELEELFDIEFTDDEMIDPSFKTVGGLTRIIQGKV